MTSQALPGVAPRPVFIGGSSRSGTTLLGAMLGVGPHHLTVPEAEFKWQLWRSGAIRDGKGLVEHVHNNLIGDPRFALWGVDLTCVSNSIGFADLMTHLVLGYGQAMAKPEVRVWFDHTPGNIRFGRTLHDQFPTARFVHIVRDGRAVAASVIPLDWGPNTAVEAAHHWATQVCAGLALQSWLGPERVQLVRYEDLVQEPELTLRSVCRLLDVAYTEDMVTSRDYKVQKWTAPQHRLVANAPDAARIDAWRRRLSVAQIRDFERTTGELLDYLGYTTDSGMAAGTPGRMENLGIQAWGTARRVALNKMRFRKRARQLSDG